MGIFNRRKKIEAKMEKLEKKKKRKWFSKKGLDDSNLIDKQGLSLNSFGSCVDFTLLDPRTTSRDIDELLSIAFKNQYYCVVVPPIFVAYAKKVVREKYMGAINVCSVVGFPLGIETSKNKINEAKSLIKDGADEIEVSINISHVKAGDYGSVRAELSRISRIARKKVVKVIFETAYLEEAEIERLVKIAIKSKVDYIMTSSGYAPLGATVELVEKLNNLADGKIGIKASGGVKTRLEAESFIRLGATRVGTSRII